MAFEDSTPTTPARSRYSGEGFRQEPDFREGTATFQAVAQPATTPVAAEAESTAAVTARTPNLTYVFDDPADGEPGRDRLLVHGLLELVLAVGLGVVAYLLYRRQADAFTGTALTDLLLLVAMFGLLASASAVALRAGAVNLAVGPLAVAAALLFEEKSGGGLLTPLLITIGLCAAVGAVQGLITAALHVPSWAVSLAIGVAIVGWINARSWSAEATVYAAGPHVYLWLGAFCLASIVFNLLLLMPSVRRLFARFRPVSDPADRRGWMAGVIVIAATAGSSVLAGLGGALTASTGRTGQWRDDSLLLTVLVLGIALVGGTSAFGRRGGIFGTILATGLFLVASYYVDALGWRPSEAATAVGVLALGLVVTRLVERFGRPSPPQDHEDEEESSEWLLRSHSSPAATWPSGATYQPASTTQTATGGLWSSDDAWGANGR